MNIGIIDADLIGRANHRFPNLACMKISSWNKANGNKVKLILSYEEINIYDKIYISKVFTDTSVPNEILNLHNVNYGGTGFFFDKAPDLSFEMEHSCPDYDLYSAWVETQLASGVSKIKLKDYTDSSIGFLTRGCFRKCAFCVNKKYDRSFIASPLCEFFDRQRKTISLWDDNFLSHPKWRELLSELKSTETPFQFRQGLDLRLITEEKANLFSDVKYSGDYIFAFDHIDDSPIIKEKLAIWKSKINKTTKLYVFCGFDRSDKWDLSFWKQDIIDTFKRIRILMEYGCLPYIMRFNRYEESPFRGTYINLARWCNQPSMFKKESFREFVQANTSISGVNCATNKYFDYMLSEIAGLDEFCDMKYNNLNKYSLNFV